MLVSLFNVSAAGGMLNVPLLPFCFNPKMKVDSSGFFIAS